MTYLMENYRWWNVEMNGNVLNIRPLRGATIANWWPTNASDQFCWESLQRIQRILGSVLTIHSINLRWRLLQQIPGWKNLQISIIYGWCSYPFRKYSAQFWTNKKIVFFQCFIDEATGTSSPSSDRCCSRNSSESKRFIHLTATISHIASL